MIRPISRWLRLLSAGCGAATLLLSQTAGADEEFERGAQHYRAANCEKAMESFRKALNGGRTDSALYLGNCYRDLGQYPEAEGMYLNAVTAKPGDLMLRNLLGEAYLLDKKLDAAQKVFEAIRKDSPDNTLALTNLGRLYTEKGELPAASEAYREVLKYYPKDAGALAGLGHANAVGKNWVEASKYYSDAIQQAPNDGELRLAHAHSLEQQNRDQDAILQFQVASTLLPEARVYRRLAQALARQGQLPDALRAYQQVVAMNAADAALYAEISSIFEKQKNWDECLIWVRKSIAGGSKDPLAYQLLGTAHLQLEHWDDAAKAFDTALQLDAGLAAARNGKGKVLSHNGKWKEAANEFFEATKAGGNVEFRRNLALAYMKDGQWVPAIDTWKQLRGLAPEDDSIELGLAQSYLGADKPKDAEPIFKKYLERHPKSPEAFQGLAEIRGRENEWQAAADYYEKSLAAGPTDSIAVLEELLVVYTELKKWPEFHGFAKRLLELQPDKAEYHFNLGLAELKLENYQQAIFAFEAARQRNMETRQFELNRFQGEAYFRLKRYDESAAAYLRALAVEPGNANATYSLGVVYVMLKDKENARKQVTFLEQMNPELAKKLKSVLPAGR